MRDKIKNLSHRIWDRRITCGATQIDAYSVLSALIPSYEPALVTGAEHPLTATRRKGFRSPSEVHSSVFRTLPFSKRQLSADRSSQTTYSSSAVSDIEIIIQHRPGFVKGGCSHFFAQGSALPLIILPQNINNAPAMPSSGVKKRLESLAGVKS